MKGLLDTYVMERSWRESFLDDVLVLARGGVLGNVKDFTGRIWRGESIEMNKN